MPRAFALALAALLLVSGCDSGSSTTSVTYRVNAYGEFPATRASRIEWNDSDGNRQSQTDVALPWTRTVEIESGGTALLKATSTSAVGAVGMRVKIATGDEVIAEDEADGSANATSTLELSVSNTVE